MLLAGGGERVERVDGGRERLFKLLKAVPNM